MLFYGWINVILFVLAYSFLMTPFLSGFGVLIGPMSQGIGISLTQASLAITICIVVSGLTQPIAAKLVNKFGARQVIFLGSIFLAAAGLLMYFFVNNLLLYYIAYVVIGFGTSLGVMVPSQASITSWFFRKRATAMALFFAGGSIGVAIIIPLMAKLLVYSGNWRTVWLWVSILALVTGLSNLIFTRNRPEEMNLYPDGIKPGDELPGSGMQKETAGNIYRTTDNWEVGEALRAPTFYLLIIIGIVLYFVSTGLISHAINYLQEVGFTVTLAAFTMTVYSLVGIVARLLSGYLGDRYSPKIIMTIGLGFLLIAILSLVTVYTTPFLIYIYAAAFGLGMGFCLIPLPVLIANYFGATNFASINALFLMVTMLISSFATFVTGFIRDSSGNYINAWYLYIGLLILAIIASLFAVPPKKASAK